MKTHIPETFEDIENVEARERTGTTKILKTIAKVLAVDLEDIV